jgi:hypothetical protein
VSDEFANIALKIQDLRMKVQALVPPALYCEVTIGRLMSEVCASLPGILSGLEGTESQLRDITKQASEIRDSVNRKPHTLLSQGDYFSNKEDQESIEGKLTVLHEQILALQEAVFRGDYRLEDKPMGGGINITGNVHGDVFQGDKKVINRDSVSIKDLADVIIMAIEKAKDIKPDEKKGLAARVTEWIKKSTAEATGQVTYAAVRALLDKAMGSGGGNSEE